jgi:hypothetical protein
MKRCPKCNQTFDEGWLSFCTNDGTTLVEEPTSSSDMMKTIMAPAPPPVSRPNEQANWSSPSGGLGAGQFPVPQPSQPVWQPPPPPSYAAGPKQGLAIASLICGVFSITLGWCCSIGLLTSPAAIVMGIVSLVQIKNSPDQNAGKPLAIAGIATGAVYLVFWVLIILIWGIGALMQGLK